jgi:DNA-directed RNA polymerase specialized sigma24 family protein
MVTGRNLYFRRSLDQFDGRAPFQHWLNKIVALDHLRKQKRVRNDIGLPGLGEDTLEWLRERRNL